MAPLDEISMEAKHALGKIRVAKRHKKTRLTPQLFSTELRFPEFHSRSKDPTFNKTLVNHFTELKARDPLTIVQRFGLQTNQYLHESMHMDERSGLKQQDVALAMYHCDPKARFLAHKQQRKDFKRHREHRRSTGHAGVADGIEANARSVAADERAAGRDVTNFQRVCWVHAVSHMRKDMAGRRDVLYSCVLQPGVSLSTVHERHDRYRHQQIFIDGEVIDAIVDADRHLGDADLSDMAPEPCILDGGIMVAEGSHRCQREGAAILEGLTVHPDTSGHRLPRQMYL